jgi:hypothetical protein
MDNENNLSVRKRLLDKVRCFNRRYFNPFAMGFAGRPSSFWSVIKHVGRHSGKEYTTPVVAALHGDYFIVPLPYGQKVDWLRNTMSSGGCTLIYQGKVYSASRPETIAFEEGILAFSGLIENLLRNSDTKRFLRLNQYSEMPYGETIYRSFVEGYPSERSIWILATIGSILAGLGFFLHRFKSEKSASQPYT